MRSKEFVTEKEKVNPQIRSLVLTARAMFPAAHNDEEALALYAQSMASQALDKETKDVKRIDKVNKREDDDIDRLERLERNLETSVSTIDHRLNNLERRR